MSEATARNGVGRLSKFSIRDTCKSSSRKIRLSFCPSINPFGKTNLPSLTPSSNFTGKAASSCFRRNDLFSRLDSSVNASAQSSDSASSCNSAGVFPEAYKPPTIAPILVPTIASIGTRRRSSSLSTPMCAAPRAPPPPRTRPIRGLSSSCGVCGDCAAVSTAIPMAQRTNKN